MEPVAKRINDKNGRRKNTYFMIGKCSKYQAQNSQSLNNFVKDVSEDTILYPQNENNQQSAPIGATVGGGVEVGRRRREVENVCRGYMVGKRAARATWKGISPIAKMEERKIKETYHPNMNMPNHPNFYLNTNPSANVNIGMLSRMHIPTLHPSNVNMTSPSNINRSMFHVTAGMEQRRTSDQSIRMHPEGRVPIFYEPLKYPAFKMADRLKKEKVKDIETSKENFENKDIIKKEREKEKETEKGAEKETEKEIEKDAEKESEKKTEAEKEKEHNEENDIDNNDNNNNDNNNNNNNNNDHVGIMKTKNENKDEEVQIIGQGKKTIHKSSKYQGEVHVHYQLLEKSIQRNGKETKVKETDEKETDEKETDKKEKHKCKVSKYRKELIYNEKFNETNESDEEDGDHMCSKQAHYLSGEANGEINTYSNRDHEEIKEFLTLSLNPSNITIKPETITNEIKFILHMTLLTLYKDQIKPTYRKIKRRLKCFSENFEIKYNFLNIYALLQNQYIVVRSKNNNVFVLLRETPKWFLGWVNTKSFSNIYPKNVWKYFITYLLDISRAKWEYAYSSFLLKFINYLKQNQLLFYVQSSKKDYFSHNGTSVKEALNFEELIGESEDFNENPENHIYRCIDEKKIFTFFSYLDTFYNEKREKAFCDSYISILKKEGDLSNTTESVSGEMNDDVSLQKNISFSEKWKQEDNNNNSNNNNNNNNEKNNVNNYKNICNDNNNNNNNNNNINNINNNNNDELQIEKLRKQQEQTKATRRCYEKYKTIFSSEENALRNEKNTDKKKNKWEFDNDIYEMANFLKKQNFLFFKNYSLGKIAHIIQLSLYSGLLMEEGGCIKPACSVKTIVPSVFYFKDLQGEDEEKKDVLEQQHKKMQMKMKEKKQEETETGELVTRKMEMEEAKIENFAGDIYNSNTSIFFQENVFHEKQEHSFEKDDLYYDDSYLDQDFSFGLSEYSKFEGSKFESESESESESELKLGKKKKDIIKGDVFEQMLKDVREARTSYSSYEYPNLETKKRELFHWKYLCTKKSDICEKEVSCDIKEPNLFKINSKNALFSEAMVSEPLISEPLISETVVSETPDVIVTNEKIKKWDNCSEHKRNDELMENVKLIKNLEEVKTKIERLLKRSYRKQIFLYLFREKFYKKYKELINPLYFGYNSLIEFLFFACKEVCKIYIINKHIVLIHPSCNISHLQNKKENTIQLFSYLDYFYSAPEKKKESENRKEKKNKNEQTTKIENPSLEICSIMKDLAKKKNNLFITFNFWKKWNTRNKNILNEVNFFKPEENMDINNFQIPDKCKYYSLFNSKRGDLFDLSELLKK